MALIGGSLVADLTDIPRRKQALRRSIPVQLFTGEPTGKIITEMEKSTGLPLRLAYLALTAAADRWGTIPYDLDLIDEKVSPLDHWPWERILECLCAMAYIDIWSPEKSHLRYVSYITLRGWRRVQSIYRSERTIYPTPPTINTHLKPVAVHPGQFVVKHFFLKQPPSPPQPG